MSYAMDSDNIKYAKLKWTLANVDKANPNIPYLKAEIAVLEKKLKKKVGKKNWNLLRGAIAGYYEMTYGKKMP